MNYFLCFGALLQFLVQNTFGHKVGFPVIGRPTDRTRSEHVVCRAVGSGQRLESKTKPTLRSVWTLTLFPCDQVILSVLWSDESRKHGLQISAQESGKQPRRALPYAVVNHVTIIVDLRQHVALNNKVVLPPTFQRMLNFKLKVCLRGAEV